MKLHRLLLENVRGVTRREIVFPPVGVIVIDGPNEVGKTSMLQALDLLLEEKDTSTKARIRDIKPVGADVGSVIEADLSVGRFRLVFRKQFNRGAATTLTVVEPEAEQFTGSAAHERVREILADALDPALFKAVRLLQAAPLDQAALAGSAALAAALDRAAGVAGDPDTADPLALAAQEEYEAFFTSLGRPRGDYRRAIEALEAEQDRVRAAEDLLAGMAQDADRLSELVADRGVAAAEVERARCAWQEARAEAQAATELRQQLRDAETERRSAAGAVDRVVAERDRRRRQAADVARRAGRVAVLTTGATEVEQRSRELGARADEQVEEWTTKAHEAEAASALAALARADADHLRRRCELADLNGQITAIAGVRQGIAAAEAGLDAGVDRARLQGIEDAEVRLRLAEAELRGGAAELTVQVRSGGQVTLGGQPLEGQVVVAVTDDLMLEVPDTLVARIRPGRGATELAAAVTRAQAGREDALRAAGVSDVQQARARHEDHRRAEQAATTLRRDLEHLTKGRPDAVIAEAAQLLAIEVAQDDRRRPADRSLPADIDEVQVKRRAAEKVAADARTTADVALRELEKARRELHVVELAGARAQAELAAESREARTSLDALAAERIGRSDPQLDAAVADGEQAAALAVLAERALRAQLPAGGLDAAHSRLLQAERRLRDAEQRWSTLHTEIAALTARLDVEADQGRQEVLDQALTDLAAASRAHSGLRVRAQAARLLHEVLSRHRDEAREAYVAPFQQQLRRLGRLVYGPRFDISVAPDLRVVGRTLDGVTVPFEQLSSGAQEQLAVLVRLSCAAVIDPRDSVPLFFDDALGHSDPDRLAALAAAFTATAASAQVIVLTSSPDRFSGIDGAHLIRISPDTVTTVRAEPSLRVPRRSRVVLGPPAPALFETVTSSRKAG